ncbi:hypothetical protein GGI23_003240, partial [Coemansia sp. RSA 2559]
MSPLTKSQLHRQAEQLVDFVNKSPSPFHVVDVCRKWLRSAQFTELKEKQSWEGTIQPNGRHTWFDRDLSVAGRVMVKDTNGGYTSRLVAIEEPIMRIPSLAIHLDRSLSDGIKFNKETHLTPILATVSKALNGTKTDESPKASEAKKPAHHPILLERIAKELNVSVSDIFDFELCLYDTQKAVIGGICNEFIYSARLDNLNSSYCAIE